MAYTKTTWVTGDKVTSTKLNKIEQGIFDNDAACDELKTAFTQEVGQLVFSGSHSYAGGSENWQTFTPTANTTLAIRIPNNNGSSVEVALYIERWIVVETISDNNYHIVDVPSNVSNKVIFTYRGESAVTLSVLVVNVTNANLRRTA